MEHKSISIMVAVLTPDELFDAVMEKGRVSAHSIYHKDATEVTGDDIREALLGISPAHNYVRVNDTEEICFCFSPVKYFRTKEQFRFAPTRDDSPCKAAYIVIG